jgi:hypothetical protein
MRGLCEFVGRKTSTKDLSRTSTDHSYMVSSAHRNSVASTNRFPPPLPICRHNRNRRVGSLELCLFVHRKWIIMLTLDLYHQKNHLTTV